MMDVSMSLCLASDPAWVKLSGELRGKTRSDSGPPALLLTTHSAVHQKLMRQELRPVICPPHLGLSHMNTCHHHYIHKNLPNTFSQFLCPWFLARMRDETSESIHLKDYVCVMCTSSRQNIFA